MGICKFCGEDAGFFGDVHPACQFKHDTDIIVNNFISAPVRLTNDIASKSQLPDIYVENDRIHDDVKSLLWFGDGKYKNITREQMSSDGEYYEIGGYRIKIRYHGGADIEPSLILMNLPIKQPVDEMLIPRPPYYPQYVGLTPEQRWIYLKLLINPYNDKIDIGYVFILYYGLERHLLHGDFD
jgi:hypothetical protein